MAIRPGDRIPDARFGIWSVDGVDEISAQEIFAGKRVALFAVPGAFTPACSDSHLPGFLLRATELRERGVDTIACVAVNDAHVMAAWGRARNVGEEILLLADGNGEFARAMGLAFDASPFGMGERSRRYAAIVDDGVVRWLQVEPAGGVTVSSAESLLAAL